MLNSMGYVTYKIRLRAGLSPLTKIKNTAYIYFDYNAPVVTNTTLNTIEQPGSVDNALLSADEFSLYPNPAHSLISVKATKDLKLIRIYNAMGMMVYENQAAMTDKVTIALPQLSSGIYFVELHTADKSRVIKLMME